MSRIPQSSSGALPNLVLASQSPRRKQILENVGLAFLVETPTAEEAHPNVEKVQEVTLQNSYDKAASILSRFASPKDIALGADTLVVIDNHVIGKPENKEGVLETLRKLSGRTHEVVTGLTLLSPHYGCRKSVTLSRVTFRSLEASEIEEYAQTKEPYDKAGSYAVQGLGTLFISEIKGSYTNVMGLPVETLLPELSKLTGISPYQWFLK